MDEDKRDQATKVANNLIDLKDQIVESQMKLAERGQKLDLLVEKSDALKIETKVYKARAKEVKNTMWWSKYKLYLVVGGIGAVLLLLLILWLSGAFDADKPKKEMVDTFFAFAEIRPGFNLGPMKPFLLEV